MLSVITFSSHSAEDVNLRLIGTSDLHAYIDNFDFYRNEESSKYGLVNLVAEIEQYRGQRKNTVLADTGDLLVGSPFGDYLSQHQQEVNFRKSPIMSVLNALKFDVAAPGNHDFDNGLDYLHAQYDQADFPIVLSNVYYAGSDKPYFNPYLIVPKSVTAEDGTVRVLNIGYIGIVPPQTMDLNKKWLEGKIDIVDPLPEAEKWAKKARQDGADIVVALAHSGVKDVKYVEGMEDMTWYLAKIEEVDAILFGHTHKPFPSKKYAKTKNVDIEKGTIHGKPAAQPGKWGDHIGIVDLSLSYDNGWEVNDGSAFVVKSNSLPETIVQQDLVRQFTSPLHDMIVAEFDKSVGKIDRTLRNDFNLLANDTVYQIVNDSMKDYLKSTIKTDLPILASAAPAVHRNDPAFYFSVEKGEVNMRDVGAIVYSSTLAAKEVTGEDIKEWLEISASMYSEPSDINGPIIKPDHLTFLYYIIDGIDYQIHLSEPSTHNAFGYKISEGDGRVRNIRYKGRLVEPTDKFVIISSSYNPFFAKEMKAGKTFIEIGSPNSRDVLRDYVSKSREPQYIDVINNWKIILDKGKYYTFTARNDADNLKNFKNLTGINIKFEKKVEQGNVYQIK